MKLSELFAKKIPTLSFEVFPPKTSDTYDSVKTAVEQIANLHPDYMSVTYGAGGGTSAYTVAVAQEIMARGVTPLAHLTCLSSTKEKISEQLDILGQKGIET